VEAATICSGPSKWWYEKPTRSFIGLVILTCHFLTLELVCTIPSCVQGQPSCQFWCFCEFYLSSYGQTPVKLTTYSYNLYL